MSALSAQLLLYIACFVAVWFGAGLVVSSVSLLAHRWKLPPFTISFFILGILTSLPEIAISTQAVLDGDPAIAVGNLLGGVIVVFMLIIPLLGLIGNRIKVPKDLSQKHLALILTAVVAPALLVSDQRLDVWEGILLVILYVVLFVFLFRKQSLGEKLLQTLKQKKKVSWKRLVLKILAGVAILWLASNQIVELTLQFSSLLAVSPFIVSLVIVSLGTNIPEISLIFHSIRRRQKSIALADYLGSAVANTLLLGLVAIFYGDTIVLPNHFLYRLIFVATGLILFLFFARTKNTITKRESLILLACYVAFLWMEAKPLLEAAIK